MARAASSVPSPGSVAVDMGWLPFSSSFVAWVPRERTRPGKPIRRPRSRFRLHRSVDAGIIRGMHTAGVDLGGTKVQGVIVGHDGARVGEARGRTPVADGPAAVVAEIAKVVRGAAK